MLVAAALCPAAPLLARELTGADPVVPELRQACLDAAAFLLAAEPAVVAIVGVAAQACDWPADGALDLAAFAPALRRPARSAEPVAAAAASRLPVPLGLGGMLLDQVGYAGRRLLRSVTQDDEAADCAALGARLAGADERAALLVMADGSARRTLRAPGYLDERSVPFDAEVERAITGGDLRALLALDAVLARDLMATGRPAWQVLAGAVLAGDGLAGDGLAGDGHRLAGEPDGRRAAALVRYRDDPFGVFYLVASLTCGRSDGSAAAGSTAMAGCDTQADVATCRDGRASWTV